MTKHSLSNVVSIRTFQGEHLNRQVGEIVERLKVQQSKIEQMIARLSKCVLTVRIVEQSLGVASSSASTETLHRLLEDAQVALADISSELNLITGGASL